MSQQAPVPVPFASHADVAVHVPDLEQARSFYGGVLGFRLIHEQGNHLAFHTGLFTLWVNQDDKVMSYIPSYTVPSYEQAREYLIANGCQILKEYPDYKSLYFVDPFGIVADVIEKQTVSPD